MNAQNQPQPNILLQVSQTVGLAILGAIISGYVSAQFSPKTNLKEGQQIEHSIKIGCNAGNCTFTKSSALKITPLGN